MSNGMISDESIRQSISQFKSAAIKEYNNQVLKIDAVQEEDDLIKILFECKMKAIEKYNEIFKANPDAFNNPEYLSWNNQAKGEIEEEIGEMERKKLQQNASEGKNLCKNLSVKEYEKINEKIEGNLYNSQNCDEYLKDYENFINNYNQKAKGPNKLNILIDYLYEKKIAFLDSFINNLEKENKDKIAAASKKLEESNKMKRKAEEEFNNLNDKTEENSKVIDDLNSNIQKKKREIKNLYEQIEQVEEEIRKARNEDEEKPSNAKVVL